MATGRRTEVRRKMWALESLVVYCIGQQGLEKCKSEKMSEPLQWDGLINGVLPDMKMYMQYF